MAVPVAMRRRRLRGRRGAAGTLVMGAMSRNLMGRVFYPPVAGVGAGAGGGAEGEEGKAEEAAIAAMSPLMGRAFCPLAAGAGAEGDEAEGARWEAGERGRAEEEEEEARLQRRRGWSRGQDGVGSSSSIGSLGLSLTHPAAACIRTPRGRAEGGSSSSSSSSNGLSLMHQGKALFPTLRGCGVQQLRGCWGRQLIREWGGQQRFFRCSPLACRSGCRMVVLRACSHWVRVQQSWGDQQQQCQPRLAAEALAEAVAEVVEAVAEAEAAPMLRSSPFLLGCSLPLPPTC